MVAPLINFWRLRCAEIPICAQRKTSGGTSAAAPCTTQNQIVFAGRAAETFWRLLCAKSAICARRKNPGCAAPAGSAPCRTQLSAILLVALLILPGVCVAPKPHSTPGAKTRAAQRRQAPRFVQSKTSLFLLVAPPKLFGVCGAPKPHSTPGAKIRAAQRWQAPRFVQPKIRLFLLVAPLKLFGVCGTPKAQSTPGAKFHTYSRPPRFVQPKINRFTCNSCLYCLKFFEHRNLNLRAAPSDAALCFA